MLSGLHQKVRMFQLAAARSNYYALEAHLLLLLIPMIPIPMIGFGIIVEIFFQILKF